VKIRVAILILSLILAGPSYPEASLESFSERAESEVAIEEALVVKSVRLTKIFGKRRTSINGDCSDCLKFNSSQILPVNRDRVIQFRQLLI